MCFYSILVRLKENYTKLVNVVVERFLFHTGSIKRLYENHKYIIRDLYGPCQVNFYFPRF